MNAEAFVGRLKTGPSMEPDENVFASIWNEYERVVVESLITSFGLEFFINDQHGGDVDTIHNVRAMKDDQLLKYKNKRNEIAYNNRGEYNKQTSVEYHSDPRYISINRKISEHKKNGTLEDSYTGKKVERNANIDLDHVVSAKEIHDDTGRVLAGLDGKELANCEENLCPTNRSINRSMQDKDIEDYLEKWKQDQPRRQERIKELKGKNNLTDKERKELNKLEKLEEIDPNKMLAENKKAREAYDRKIDRAYYASKKFALDTARAAGKRGAQMGARQALGFVFAEMWFTTKEEVQRMPAGCDLKEILEAVGCGIKRGIANAKVKYEDIIEKFLEGFGAGVLASLTTTICNIFFTTAKNLVKSIRQIYASVVQAGKVLLFNPEELLFGDRIKSATVIIATGASVLVGTAVGELIGKTPLGMAPAIGDIVQTFCSTLVSGLISCSLLVFLDRSKFMNNLISCLNAIPTEVNNYAEIAMYMEILAAKLGDLDIDEFRKETEQYKRTVESISNAKDDMELNSILKNAYTSFGISIPWEGDFDEFMGNKNNRLVFR